ncbi:type-F conjugative transfer system secretin TraK [Photobacterium damselae subsp. damselae]|uniref:Type-F conjugative transfer system secretin TraK n=1 Tax=Photobacterium damselae subsp. damselae TaxID=85581 RepID=A0A850QR80_PHODD|nr:type-F conjugative transfer system secretin TraK [Photobacterium damselae subsp. damselae]
MQKITLNIFMSGLLIAFASSTAHATQYGKFGDLNTAGGKLDINTTQNYNHQNKQITPLNRQNIDLNISDSHINRIITPFKNPSLKMDSVEGVSYKVMDNVIYLSTNQIQPIGAFITEKGDELTSVKLTLIPSRLPPQEINLEEIANVFSSVSARQFERSQPFIETIKDVFVSLANNNIPTGYSMGNPNGFYFPSCSQMGLTFDFGNGQFAEGGNYVVSIGIIENTSPMPIEFKEPNCLDKQNRITGIAAFPRVLLLPHQKTEVYVMMRKEEPDSSSKRQSLVN